MLFRDAIDTCFQVEWVAEEVMQEHCNAVASQIDL